ncbi:tyrosine-type recombinase/integrase [Desulfogranum marinum]|uniref:tyrosine-type recombinase/integrase n=1 Tax=Desulfogranum marinum TaxID=453220 RepID=UPI001964A2B8|nr:tyrosine-type recombinase/integrase [Desulfogranum marinum]MBM9515247.1 tyrosine-type recombinase/integrase [Desulfogranum marinum]
MNHKDSKRLSQAVEHYLLQRIEQGYPDTHIDTQHKILHDFRLFIEQQPREWDEIFTLEILKEFMQQGNGNERRRAVRGLAKFLYREQQIPQPIPRKSRPRLPELFEDYLHYCATSRYDTEKTVQHIRRILEAFDHYLKHHNLTLSAITIEHVDTFEQEYNAAYALQSQKFNRSCFKFFLKYLYHVRRVLKRDFAALLKVPRIFQRTKPPCFLRIDETQQLFDNRTPGTPSELRAYAMVHIAYTMGLRPQEISRLTLDDIQFSKAEMSVRYRKAGLPVTMPIPQKTLKAIAAYLVGGRPENDCRELFLQCCRPYRPVSSQTVCYAIKTCIQKAGLPEKATAYWLRHTHAQQLLEAGVSLFEIKEMLGHDDIDATNRYLHIDIKLMRRVILGELV